MGDLTLGAMMIWGVLYTHALILLVMMLVAWGCYCVTQNPAVVDGFWALGFLALALSVLWFDRSLALANITILVVIVLWAFRLFMHLLLTRIRHGHRDPRYTAITPAAQSKQAIFFLGNYLFQGCLLLIVSCPLLWLACYPLPLSWGMLPVAVVAFFALVNEALSDWQLLQHKRSGSAAVCERGWWAWSRHPNYFFDWLFWLAMAIAVVSLPDGVWALASPAMLLIIFLGMTIRLTEQQARSRRGEIYRDYQRRVSRFFPWKPSR